MTELVEKGRGKGGKLKRKGQRKVRKEESGGQGKEKNKKENEAIREN